MNKTLNQAPINPINNDNRQTMDNRSSAQHSSEQRSFAALASGNINIGNPYTQQTTSTKKRSIWRRLIALPAYYWVLIALLVTIILHIRYMPFWLTGYALLSTAAQLPRVKALSLVSRRLYQIIQILGFIVGIIGLWVTYNGTFGVDVGVAFLLLCLASKLWELYKRRDAYILLNLSFFVLAALFLMDKGLTTAVVVVFGTLVLLMGFISLNDDDNPDGSGRLRSLLLLAGQAIPLLIILFVFFPRIPPLWSLQLSSNQPITGVSDSMSPGDFANLSQSTELAFRAEFASDMPMRSQLYWRGLVFSDFDGVTWSINRGTPIWRGNEAMPLWLTTALQTVSTTKEAKPQVYKILLEPTQQRWLFGLDYPFLQAEGVAMTSAFTLLSWQPISQQYHYDVTYYPNMRIGTKLSDEQKQINLRLPKQGNEQSRELAQRLFEQSKHDPKTYINAIHTLINNGEYRYTLSPPPLQDNRIDEFLFATKAGFCEHYASSFTFLMRAVGIPARVVVGYQGGKLGRDGSSWEVRQMDAHAWSEVWVDGQGWVRIDPTAFVAPERVELGMGALTDGQGAAMFGDGAAAQWNYQQFKIAQSLRRLSDQASYYWQKDIVGYDQQKQAGSLFKWFKIKNLMQQMLWMLSGLTLIMAVIITMIWYRRRKRWHPADLPLIQLSKRMLKVDGTYGHHPQEGLLNWLERLEQQADSEEAKLAVMQLKQQYRKLRYGRMSDSDTSGKAYRSALKRLHQYAKQIK